MSDLPNPINRYEKYLNAIATGNSDDLPTPITREEVFLDYIAKNGGGSGSGEVTGVKGNAEESYRRGNVNLTPTHLGLGNVDNTSDLNKPVSTAQQTALDGKVDKVVGKGLSTNDYDDTAKGIVNGVTSALAGKVDTLSVGSANGVAELDANGRVPSSQLPSYVDDTVEGYLNSVDGKFYADSSYTTEITGETGKIYVTLDTNKTYRWSGSGFVEISESLALGETSSTAYAGNKGKANADAIAAIKDGTNIDSFGDVETALAGKASTSDLGNISNLTTTNKSNAVSAINEVNFIAGTLYYSIIATDTKDFISKLVARIDTDIASKPGYTIYNVFAFHQGVQGFFGTVVRIDVHGYCFYFSTESSNKQYQGFVDISSETVVVHEYMSSEKKLTVVNLNSAYDADTDWNIVKQGNICVMNMRNLKDIPEEYTVIGTIPVGFRPEWGFYEYVYSANKDVHLGFNIADNGDLQILNQTGAAISGTVYVNRNVTYFTA